MSAFEDHLDRHLRDWRQPRLSGMVVRRRAVWNDALTRAAEICRAAKYDPRSNWVETIAKAIERERDDATVPASDTPAHD